MSEDQVHQLDVSQIPHQRKFIRSRKKIVLLSGAIGAGKTFPGCVKAFQATQEAPGARVALVRKQLSDLKSSTLNTLLKGDRETPPVIPPEYIVSHNKSEHRIVVKAPGGKTSEIIYSGLDKGRGDRYPKKLGSTEFTDIFIDELEEIDEDDFDYLMGRLRRPKKTPGGEKIPKQIFGATNPGGPAHWAHRRFINPEERPDHVDVFFAKTEDNPFLDDDYVETLKETYTGVMKDRLLEGKWVAAEGQVFQNFDRQVHEKDPEFFLKPEDEWEDEDEPELREYKKFVVGADAGFTNPRALVLIGVTGNDEIHILDEFYRTRTDIDEAIEWLDSLDVTVDRIYHDPSEPSDIEELNKAGYSAEKANNDISSGISHMASKIGNTGDQDPRLFVHPSVTNWKNEIASYRYPQDSRMKDEKPLKENDHLMDATRYALMGIRGGGGLSWTTL